MRWFKRDEKEPAAPTKPIEMFDFIFYKNIRDMSLACCANIMEPTFRPWLGTYLFALSMIVAIVGSFYTLYACDMDKGLNTIITWGTTIQGIIKYRTVVYCRAETREVVANLRLIYVANDRNSSDGRYAILFRWASRFVVMLKAFDVMIFAMVLLFLNYPIIVYVFTGSRVEIVPIYLPYVDEHTNAGYAFLYACHATWLIQVGFGLSGSDALLAMQVFHVFPMVELFEFSFEEMNRALELSPDVTGASRQVELWIRNLIQMHQEISRFLKGIARVYSAVFFVDVYSNALTMCFAIFILMIQTWVPLYVLFVVTLVKLFVICVLGTIVETATDRILQSIQRSKWYLLPIRLQRHIMLMLVQAQNPTILRTGAAPLNLDTFVNVLKNVYSVAMILAESME